MKSLLSSFCTCANISEWPQMSAPARSRPKRLCTVCSSSKIFPFSWVGNTAMQVVTEAPTALVKISLNTRQPSRTSLNIFQCHRWQSFSLQCGSGSAPTDSKPAGHPLQIWVHFCDRLLSYLMLPRTDLSTTWNLHEGEELSKNLK